MPHVEVCSTDGESHSLLDGVPSGWLLLLAGGDSSAWEAAAETIRAQGFPLNVLSIHG